MRVVRSIVDYLKTTGGCQVLVIRADTGSGKTTFLNTLPYYIQNIEFHTKTIDLQPINNPDDFGAELRKVDTSSSGINLIILEGREKPESINDRYIQITLSDINRFSRERRIRLLIVIPTIDEQVARNWCEHASRLGDLIPEQTSYEGSRWYTFPGVPKDKWIEISENTVRALNPPRNLYDFGVSPDSVKVWADNASTIGKFIEILARKISDRRGESRISVKGKREHVWVIYCSPDLQHYDHTYLVLDGLVQDERLRVSPTKLVPQNADTSKAKAWRESSQWAKLIATIDFLDVRLINFPIITLVTSALVYGRENLLKSFKETSYEQYKDEIIRHLPDAKDWDQWSQSLASRRLQPQNARDSLERTNLFLLLRGMHAEQKRGGLSESINVLAQYLHLRDHSSESDLHYYVGRALEDLLRHHQFPGLIGSGVQTEIPLILGRKDPQPDVSVHTESDTYALEFHFLRKQITSSEVTRYALENVISKYMRALPYLSAVLNTMN